MGEKPAHSRMGFGMGKWASSPPLPASGKGTLLFFNLVTFSLVSY